MYAGDTNYYTLTPASYHHLFGDDAPAPPKGMFREVGLSRQRHTFWLETGVLLLILFEVVVMVAQLLQGHG